MHWNFFNGLILCAVSALILFCGYRLFKSLQGRTAQLMYGFVLCSSVVILQVILIDIGLTKAYPALLLFYLPLQFLCPVLFIGFTYSYIDRFVVYKRHLFALMVPFAIFFLLYILLKVNVVLNYSLVTQATASFIGAELDENTALTLSLAAAIWNYRVIARYEKGMGNLPYQIVIKKTKWLKQSFIGMVVLCLLWLMVIIYLKIDDQVSGHGPYYPLWILFILFYCGFFFSGAKHLKKVDNSRKTETELIQSLNLDFHIRGLSKIYDSAELLSIRESQFRVTEVLSYFATSLFDKNTISEVVWDIAKNCMAKLGLEDCVIYIYDKKSNALIQRAAYGNKDNGNRKILSPIEIPIGKGIVGSAAETLQWQLVDNLEQDRRYIVDDKARKSELAVPIVHEKTLVGVLDSEHSEEAFFTEKHLLLFQLIAKLTATKLHQLKKDASNGLTDDNCYYKRFVHWLETQKAFLDPNLSLQTSSEHLNISVGYLSQIINTLGGVNFSEFINVYRINEAKRLLLNRQFANYTIAAIGLEAGFNSKSAFYTAFKKHTGETPSEYRQRYKMVS